MKRFLKSFLVFMLVILIIIQFIRPAKNTSLVKGAYDISTKYPLPDSVNDILKVACYDCHSDNTRYPWYSTIQPVYFWLNGHIRDGKRALNFSSFTNNKIRRQYNSFGGIRSLVKDGGMPLSSYLWIHSDAKLSETQKQLIISWANTQHDYIRANYPPDSLVNPR